MTNASKGVIRKVNGRPRSRATFRFSSSVETLIAILRLKNSMR